MSVQVEGADPLEGWVAACRFLESQRRRSAYHLVARIGVGEINGRRLDDVERLLGNQGLQSAQTVANTVFPRGLAERCDDVEHLSERYRKMMPKLMALRKNSSGTYFGRLVSFPNGDKYSDQLVNTVSKMRREIDGRSFTSIYECAIYHPGKDGGKSMNFPCLSFLAFHLDHGNSVVHLTATYRNHYMVERGLGNYIGLADLRNYVAAQVGFSPGELLVVSGHAVLDRASTAVKSLLETEPFSEVYP